MKRRRKLSGLALLFGLLPRRGLELVALVSVGHFEGAVALGDHAGLGRGARLAGARVTRTGPVGEEAARAAHEAHDEAGHGRGGHGAALALAGAVRVEHEVRAQGEPAPLPRLAARLEAQVAGQHARRLDVHLEQARAQARRRRQELGRRGGRVGVRLSPARARQARVARIAHPERLGRVVGELHLVPGAAVARHLLEESSELTLDTSNP